MDSSIEGFLVLIYVGTFSYKSLGQVKHLVGFLLAYFYNYMKKLWQCIYTLLS